MNARENILSLYRRQGFESIPVDMDFCPAIEEAFRVHHSEANSAVEHFAFGTRSVPAPEVALPGEIDWMAYFPGQTFKEGTCFSDTGVGHEPGSDAACHMTKMLHPMEGFTSLEQYQVYPYLTVTDINAGVMRSAVAGIHERGFAAIGGMACTVWETAWYMRGMENLMMDMMTEEETAVYHLDRVTEIGAARAAAYARAGCDLIHMGDDIGMQESIMMSETLYRDWIKPRLSRVIDAARAVKPDVLILYHTCGYVTPLIEDLIDAGIDILNPVQPECMDFSEIHAQFGDRLSFNGTIGTQTTMPFGTVEEVRREVFKNLDIAGAKGGLLPCPTHLLEPEVPWENIEAYAEACREYTSAGA